MQPAGALRDRALQLEAARDRLAVGPVELERAELADAVPVDGERPRAGGSADRADGAARAERVARRLGEQRGRDDVPVGRERRGVRQRGAAAARVHRDQHVVAGVVQEHAPAERDGGAAVAPAQRAEGDRPVVVVDTPVDVVDRVAVVAQPAAPEARADQRLREPRGEQRLEVQPAAHRHVGHETEQRAHVVQIRVRRERQPERRRREEIVQRAAAVHRDAVERSVHGVGGQHVVGDDQRRAQVAHLVRERGDVDAPFGEPRAAAEPVRELLARLSGQRVVARVDGLEHAVVEPEVFRVHEEPERAAQRETARGDAVERDPALHVDDGSLGERIALDRRPRRPPREQHAVDLGRGARVRLDRRVDRDVLDRLVGEIGLQRRGVDQPDHAVAHPRGEVVRRGRLARRRGRRPRRAAGAVERQRSVGVAGDRQHRFLDRDGGEAEAVLAAREDVAQRVVDVDALRVEHRVAVLGHMDVEQHGVVRPQRLVPDRDLVAGRRGEGGLERGAHDDVPRRDQHDEERRHRRGDDHRATRRSHAKHRFLRPRAGILTNMPEAPENSLRPNGSGDETPLRA